MPTWRIRVDNNLNRAIIEVRSSESGQVLRQYPTQSQIRAFERAEELVSRQQAKAQDAAPQPSHVKYSAPQQEAPSFAPAPKQAASSAPAPQVAAGSSDAASSTTQSIEV